MKREITLGTIYRYYLGWLVCKIIGHKPDKEMEQYDAFCCDRCYLIKQNLSNEKN